MSGYDIYVKMKGGPGSTGLHNARTLAASEAEAEARRAEMIRKLGDLTSAGWQGQAGEAAHGAVAPIAEAARVASDNLEKTTLLFEVQAGTFDEDSGRLAEITSPEPPESGFLNDITPWTTDTDQKINDYHDASQHNVRVYSEYDGASSSNAYAMPTDYPRLHDTGDNINVRPPEQPVGPPPVKPPNNTFVPPPGGHDGTTTQQGWQQTPGGVTPVTPPQVQAGPVAQGSQGSGGGTTPQWTAPQTLQGGGDGPNGPYGQGPGQGGGGPYGQGPYGQGGGPFGAGAYGVGGSGGSEHGAGGRGGAGGLGARGGFGGGGAGGFGGGAGAGAGTGAGEHGSGSRGGLAGGAGAADDGRAGGRGGQAGGMGGAGRGGGQGGEDEEHERASFLIEDDPEAVFGTDEVTAPPVIGG
ncbi:hypothetical protein ACOBQX_16150 [Actinokineospora sp. G85]|uniref:hypothetical protein n=1 Tax=Actinokineospora sp. G85 TaxID=3406626 RepID=UPI003C738EF7